MMQYRATAGSVARDFETQTDAEVWALERNASTGQAVTVERGQWIVLNRKTIWARDPAFEIIWYTPWEAKRA